MLSWLNKIERRLEPFAIANLTLYVVMAQLVVFMAAMLQRVDLDRLLLVPALCMQNGEWWRLLTFVAVPPATHWVLIAFALYFLYLAGGALEGHWGTLRYNLFLLSGYALTVGVAFLRPFAVTENVFFGGSIFLAFAYLNPNFTLYVFFILPVRIKWLALLTWVIYAWEFFTGGPAVKLAVAASVGNFLIFFGRSLWLDIRSGRRRMAQQVQKAAERREAAAPRHRCRVCGKDSHSHPAMDFRYCSKCAGDQCYCEEHLRDHVHVTADEIATQK